MELDAQKIAAWARTKPAGEEYDYLNNNNCALAQYLQANGYPDAHAGGFEWFPDTGFENTFPIPTHIIHLLYGEDTFGALADRLEAIT